MAGRRVCNPGVQTAGTTSSEAPVDVSRKSLQPSSSAIPAADAMPSKAKWLPRSPLTKPTIHIPFAATKTVSMAKGK